MICRSRWYNTGSKPQHAISVNKTLISLSENALQYFAPKPSVYMMIDVSVQVLWLMLCHHLKCIFTCLICTCLAFCLHAGLAVRALSHRGILTAKTTLHTKSLARSNGQSTHRQTLITCTLSPTRVCWNGVKHLGVNHCQTLSNFHCTLRPIHYPSHLMRGKSSICQGGGSTLWRILHHLWWSMCGEGDRQPSRHRGLKKMLEKLNNFARHEYSHIPSSCIYVPILSLFAFCVHV